MLLLPHSLIAVNHAQIELQHLDVAFARQESFLNRRSQLIKYSRSLNTPTLYNLAMLNLPTIIQRLHFFSFHPSTPVKCSKRR